MAIKITPKTAEKAAAASPELNELFQRIPVQDLANKLHTDESTAQEALSAALPALLAKLQDNASTAQGASSLASALQRHNNQLASGNRVNLDEVDTQDGHKILRHVFGNEQPRVTQQLADSTSGASKGVLDSLLPMLAPIAMSFLSNKLSGGNQSRQLQQQDDGFDLGGLLGGLLGGRQTSQSNQSGGFDVGGLLEGIFGKR